MGRPLCLPKATTAPEKHRIEKGLLLQINFDRKFKISNNFRRMITAKNALTLPTLAQSVSMLIGQPGSPDPLLDLFKVV